GGRLIGAEKASGTPSQLISRRPLGNEPATLGLRGPRKARKSSTALWISAALAPPASKTTGAALASGKETIDAANARAASFFMVPSLPWDGDRWSGPAQLPGRSILRLP